MGSLREARPKKKKKKKKRKRRRTVPADIASRPDREIMEIVLGKGVMRKVDQAVAEQGNTGHTAS